MKIVTKENYSTNVHETIFEELPDVLIQDPKNATSYFIQATELEKFQISSVESLENTITFVIPDGEYLDDVFFSHTGDNPSVLVKFPKGNSQYLLSFSELSQFEVKSFEQMTRVTDQCISFIIPTGDEFLEDIPNMSAALLQSGTPITEFPRPIEKQK